MLGLQIPKIQCEFIENTGLPGGVSETVPMRLLSELGRVGALPLVITFSPV